MTIDWTYLPLSSLWNIDDAWLFKSKVVQGPFHPEKLRKKLEPKTVSIELSIQTCSTPEKEDDEDDDEIELKPKSGYFQIEY